jgi:hypothetical protein
MAASRSDIRRSCLAGLARSCFSGVALIVASAAPALASESAPTSKVVFSGFDVAKDSHAFYSGIIVSLERDLGKSGLMFRAVGVGVGYEYDTIIGFLPATVEGDAWFGDVMIGYQHLQPGLRTALYIGAEYQNHDLSPNDPGNTINGDEVGFKVVGELETDASSRFYFGLIGAYSTAFDTYWSRARVGLRHDDRVFGIEGVFGGNEGYDNQRVGGFVTFPAPIGPHNGEISASAGYQFADDDQNFGGGGRGAYGGLGYSFSF